MAKNTGKVLPDLSATALLAAMSEAQRAELAKALGLEAPKGVTVSVIQKHGKPFLNFEGPFVPFSLSQPKAKRLVDHIDRIKQFADSGK